MRAIVKPNLDIDVIFAACAGSIKNIIDRERVLSIKAYIRGAHKVYGVHAHYKCLYALVDEHDSHPACRGKATKMELVNLYERQLVKTKAGREFYNKIINLAPLGKCPFCTFGHVSTLDHFMPKMKYPSFSISPANLVPSCSDCNKGKNEDVAEAEGGQNIHPYFDHHLIVGGQWLFAEVVEGEEAVIRYFVNPPSYWGLVDRERVKSHFRNFELGRRFSVEAAVELSELRMSFDSLSAQEVRLELQIKARNQEALHRNSWKTAMYQALAESEWYCNGGFYQVILDR